MRSTERTAIISRAQTEAPDLVPGTYVQVWPRNSDDPSMGTVSGWTLNRYGMPVVRVFVHNTERTETFHPNGVLIFD